VARNLCAVIQRRLLNWEGEHERDVLSVRMPIAARLSDVEAWLDGDLGTRNKPVI
jgi:hypothetical protein